MQRKRKVVSKGEENHEETKKKQNLREILRAAPEEKTQRSIEN